MLASAAARALRRLPRPAAVAAAGRIFGAGVPGGLCRARRLFATAPQPSTLPPPAPGGGGGEAGSAPGGGGEAGEAGVAPGGEAGEAGEAGVAPGGEAGGKSLFPGAATGKTHSCGAAGGETLPPRDDGEKLLCAPSLYADGCGGHFQRVEEAAEGAASDAADTAARTALPGENSALSADVESTLPARRAPSEVQRSAFAGQRHREPYRRGDLVNPTPFSAGGAENSGEYDANKDLGPSLDDWDLGPYYRVNRTPPGQLLHPASKEDIEILANAHPRLKYFSAGRDDPEGVFFRVVRLRDPASSPAKRTIRSHQQYGIRGLDDGPILFSIMGGLGVLMILLGLWQLRRMKWKHDIIELRRNRMQAPLQCFEEGPLPWVTDLEPWKFREVQLRGVLDPQNIFFVGPRDRNQRNQIQALAVIQLLRLRDGTCVLVNRGWGEDSYVLSGVFNNAPRNCPQMPQYVTLRGTITTGETAKAIVKKQFRVFMGTEVVGLDSGFRLFPYLEPETIAKHIPNVDREALGSSFIDVHDLFYDEDINSSPESKFPAEAAGGARTAPPPGRGAGCGPAGAPAPGALPPGRASAWLKTAAPNRGLWPATGSAAAATAAPPPTPGRRPREQSKLDACQKSDYLEFWATEATHFNYAMQWFLFGTVTIATGMWKSFFLRRWRF